jgi:hypothetical protein
MEAVFNELFNMEACFDTKRVKDEAAFHLMALDYPPDPNHVLHHCLERYIRPGSKNIWWYRRLREDVWFSSPSSPMFARLDSHLSRAHAYRVAKARTITARSLYPLFALRERLPEEVAWIIVILAHWGE